MQDIAVVQCVIVHIVAAVHVMVLILELLVQAFLIHGAVVKIIV